VVAEIYFRTLWRGHVIQTGPAMRSHAPLLLHIISLKPEHTRPGLICRTGWTDRKLRTWFYCGLLAVFVFRVLLLWVLPLDLSGDEAYYWDWGRHLDWGYFSKPPGIAWLMALAGWAGGDTAFGIRFFAVLLGTGGLWLLYELGSRMYDTRTGLMAALIFALTPANAALNLILTIDAPLVFCWTGAMLAFWGFAQSQGRSRAWAVGLTLFLAGGLLTKQMALVFYPLTFLVLAACPNFRILLKSFSFWLALVLPLAALLPTLYWNSNNDWITFTHTLHHFESGSPVPSVRVWRVLEFFGSGLGLLTPVVCILIMLLMSATILGWKQLAARERLIWIFSGLGLLIITLLAFRQRVNPNWPAVFVPGALVLLTSWSLGHWSTGYQWMDQWRKLRLPCLYVTLGCFLFFHGVIFAFSFGDLRVAALNPVLRLQGWSRLADEINNLHSKQSNPANVIFITQGHRYMTSELAFYLSGHPEVYRFNPVRGFIETQYDLWKSPAGRLGHDAFIVVYGLDPDVDPRLSACFEEVNLLKEFDQSQSPSTDNKIAIYFGRNLHSWPVGATDASN